MSRARKSIANFKLREGMPIGCKVTLRGERMYEFLDRLVTIALPRVRDFRGVSPKSFDGRGNYALGLKEQIVFPEINYDKIDEIRGMDIIICTTAQDRRGGQGASRGLQHAVQELTGRGTAHGEEERRREEQPPPQAGEQLRRQARGAEGDRARIAAAARGAVRGAAQAGRAAAQRLARCGIRNRCS